MKSGSECIVDAVRIIIHIVYQLKYIILEMFGSVALTSKLDGSVHALVTRYRFHVLYDCSWDIRAWQLLVRSRGLVNQEMLKLHSLVSFGLNTERKVASKLLLCDLRSIQTS